MNSDVVSKSINNQLIITSVTLPKKNGTST